MLTSTRRWPGLSGCCAGPLSLCGQPSTPTVPGLPGRCWRWASTWPPTRHGTCYRMPLRSKDLRRSEMNQPVSYAPPSSCCSASTPQERVPPCVACVHGWPAWCGRRTPVWMPDRRTVGELLADSEALARETLLDASLEQAPAMVRSWNQLVGSAVELWAVLPSAPNSPSWSDPMERLRAIGEAIGRSVTAGHWPGQGPTDEHLTQIADNLSHAQHLAERSGRASQTTTTDSPADLQHAPGQLMHTLYVAAHGTVVALAAYAADLQGQVETARRRRQPIAERPTALEISAAQGMIARFDGFEHLAAAAYLAGATPPSSMNPVQAETPNQRLETALAAWEVQAHRTLAPRPDPADLVRVARVQALITSTTSILTEAAAKKGHIDVGVIQRLGPSLEASQMAWNRMAKRRGELTSPASRTDPALVGAAGE